MTFRKKNKVAKVAKPKAAKKPPAPKKPKAARVVSLKKPPKPKKAHIHTQHVKRAIGGMF